jgi:hypothetical protein
MSAYEPGCQLAIQAYCAQYPGDSGCVLYQHPSACSMECASKLCSELADPQAMCSGCDASASCNPLSPDFYPLQYTPPNMTIHGPTGALSSTPRAAGTPSTAWSRSSRPTMRRAACASTACP